MRLDQAVRNRKPESGTAVCLFFRKKRIKNLFPGLSRHAFSIVLDLDNNHFLNFQIRRIDLNFAMIMINRVNSINQNI